MILGSTTNPYYRVGYKSRVRVTTLKLEAIVRSNSIILLLNLLRYSKDYSN